MIVRRLLLILTILATLPGVAEVVTDADVKAYHDCVTAASDPDGTPGKAVELCLGPAKVGIPGAQYALGAWLVNRNEAGDRTAGIQWLEKSAASGNPAAAFTLAGILLQEESPAAQARGSAALKAAVCAGYPHALAALRDGGVERANVGCPPVPEEDFNGEWLADLKPVKNGAAAAEAEKYQLKVVIEGDVPRVFANDDGTWNEVKPGRFTLEKHGQSATVVAIDRGWDFDGEWIESWTIQLLRTAPDEAHVAYLRTVNNPYMPRTFEWRAFSSFSEGSARRAKRPT
ncbi:MAG TPA: hypothetical protein VGF28_17825 [Thermoanaerobaculia bacterium]|jgi:hypothetical protein